MRRGGIQSAVPLACETAGLFLQGAKLLPGFAAAEAGIMGLQRAQFMLLRVCQQHQAENKADFKQNSHSGIRIEAADA